MKNMFTQPLTIYRGEASISPAWREADEFRMSAFAGDYRRTEPEVLAGFVRAALSTLDGENRFSLLRDVEMPFEARADMMWQAAYAITAAGIWLMNQEPERMDAGMRKALSAMMSEAFAHGILIHGHDDEGRRLKILTTLGAAGAQRLIAKEPSFCPAFTELMTRELKALENAAWEENPEGRRFYSEGHVPEVQNMAVRRMHAAWQGKPNVVFTYGTLMRGQSAEYLMGNAEWSGHACLRGYAMTDLGSFPGISESASETALGEVWFVDDDTLAQLDRHKEEYSLYIRRQVQVENSYGRLDAYAYICNGTSGGRLLREGWHARNDDDVWYAAYGSNMCAERFACYIQGGFCKDNGRHYAGCSDKTFWTGTYFTEVRGSVFFGNHSSSWGGGVAFYRDSPCGKAIVRLYRIKRSQLHEIQEQEGNFPKWYGRIACLGIGTDGLPIFTLTCECEPERVKPTEAYLNVLRRALEEECGMEKKMVERYLRQMK